MYSTPQLASLQLDDCRWLVGPEAAPWLAEAEQLLHDCSAAGVVRAAEKLRQTLSADRTHLVLEQVELRRRAKEKFPLAASMFFTPVGLEQATDAWIAHYKAGRFPPSAPVADLCCGIGGDLMALARAGTFAASSAIRFRLCLPKRICARHAPATAKIHACRQAN